MMMSLSLKQLGEYIMEWRRSKGFYTPSGFSTPENADLMLGKLMLVVSEVAEASEAVRHQDMDNFTEEIADTFIRLLDICETCGIDIETAIMMKMKANEQRPFKHGKHTSL